MSQYCLAMDDLTVHGLPRLFKENNRGRKFLWLSVFSLSVIGFICLLKNSMTQFLNHETVIKLEQKTTQQMPFPSVTICDTNRESRPDSWNQTVFAGNCSGKSRESFLFRAGCEMFLSDLEYGTTRFGSTFRYFPTDFAPGLSPNLCYTFNPKGALSQRHLRRNDGLTLFIYKNSSDQQRLKPVDLLTDWNRGLLLFARSAGEVITTSLEGSVPLKPGHWAEISLKRRVIIRKPYPFKSNCSNEARKKQLIGGKYTVYNCLTSCFLSDLNKTCGGVYSGAVPYTYKSGIKTISDIECGLNLLKRSNIMSCHCPLPCREEQFKATVTYTPLKPFDQSLMDHLSAALKLNGNEAMKLTKDDFIKVSVFFESFETEYIKEQALYSSNNLMADLGGSMGLFMGASLISLIELVILLIESGWKRYNQRNQVKVIGPIDVSA